MFNHSENYSNEALSNRLIWNSRSDKWNILVEDEYKEYEYERIFTRLLDDASKYNVIALGGKENVIAAFADISSGAQATGSLGEIYLVDGDFDFINPNSNRIIHNSFIYLDRYDIENYFIDKAAIELFAQNKICDLMEVVINRVGFTSWHELITTKLYKLFTLF